MYRSAVVLKERKNKIGITHGLMFIILAHIYVYIYESGYSVACENFFKGKLCKFYTVANLLLTKFRKQCDKITYAVHKCCRHP